MNLDWRVIDKDGNDVTALRGQVSLTVGIYTPEPQTTGLLWGDKLYRGEMLIHVVPTPVTTL